jgi:AraC family transcriptional regulator of adaptative response/methylated-DNA-[protein]-cysteine methyltransferase
MKTSKNRHPLRVRLEAASLNEIKLRGSGWTVMAGFGASPFGRCLVAQSSRGLCHLSFVDADPKAAWSEMTRLWPKACWQRDDAAAEKLLRRLFHESDTEWTAFVRGTEFQVRVWRELLKTKPGQLTNYGGLAAAVGVPGAARAVGSAVGRNEVAWVIPCHRVVRKSAGLGGYRWGQERKSALIASESGN